MPLTVACSSSAATLSRMGVNARSEVLGRVAQELRRARADDAGGGAGDLLEIGYLLGALGRARVCFVLDGKAAAASAIEGFPRHAMDEGGLWRLLLAREMKQSGLDVDLNRAI